MRQSLSETRTTGRSTTLIAAGLSLVLGAAAIVDQAGSQSLVEHATTAYTSYGKQPSAGALYGLLYGVVVVDVALWLLVAGVARRRRQIAAGLAALMVLISAGLAVLLLASSEYGVRIFPPLWGLLALLPAIAGAVAIPYLIRRRT
ncbi:hypothetical protein EV138_5176 [Kribbella voronezhensis]|uniref:Uncharacterized protein n=1 Tax=Kribbella voronezhensis TaxID=2512212 RepID=A0A4R7TIX0_9ACTN|nr:hypothetical protein [Kribbella voronezhensis]TDU91568.1 hypothetical protein EV138_5176 [Kribbella voronezhensis]